MAQERSGQGLEGALALLESMPEAEHVFQEAREEIAAQVVRRETGRVDLEFLSGVTAAVIVERGQRAAELRSGDIEYAADTALSIHGERVNGSYCMDRRTSPTLARGLPAVPQVGGSHRTEGARIGLTADSWRFAPFDPLRLKMQEASASGPSTQILDAHIVCKAQEERMLERERLEGKPVPADKGLRENVLKKAQYAAAIHEEFGPGVLPIVESFDPHNGEVFQGFDWPGVAGALQESDPDGTQGLDDGMRQRLVREELTLSSHRIAERLASTAYPRLVASAVDELQGQTDLRDHYAHTLAVLWGAVNDAWEDSVIRARVTSDIGRIADEQRVDLSPRELDMRAKLLLEAAMHRDIQTHEFKREWPYAEHDEKLAYISDSPDAGPHRTAAFLVTDENPDALPATVSTIIAGVIRNARRAEDKSRPLLAFNVATRRGPEDPGDFRVALKQRVGRRLAALQADPVTGAMMERGDLVIVNGLVGPEKNFVEILPVSSRK